MNKARVFAVAVALLGARGALAGNYSFTPLGDLPGGAAMSLARAISADGSTVVGDSNSAAGVEAFRWTVGAGMQGLGDAPGGGFASHATDVSADGAVTVGVMTTAQRTESFRHTAGSGLVGLGDASAITFDQGRNSAVSGDGNTVVLYGAPSLVWTTGGGLATLSDPATGDPLAEALSISGDGSLIGGANGPNAYLWSAGGVEYFPIGVTAISTRGITSGPPIVVGGYLYLIDRDQVDARAWMWTPADGLVLLPTLRGGFDSAAAISADGRIIVGTSGFNTAAVWFGAETVVDLQELLVDAGVTNLAGWNLRQATDISADGRTIVGYGINPLGQTEAFVVTVPEPASMWLLLVGAATVIVAGVRTRRSGG